MRKEFWRHSSRGRRPGSVTSPTDRKALAYLAIIAVKYRIDSSELLDHVIEAWDQEESMSKQMTIKCRQKTEDSAIFLFTIGQKVVAQFPIPNNVLQGKHQLEDYTRMISKRAPTVVNPKIEDLKAGMKDVDLKVRVLEIPEPNRVYTRFGTPAYVSNALVSDETGTIRMSLWNQQISAVSEGDEINVEKGRIASYRGELQLRIGRDGILSVTGNGKR
jgi:replication factor A1